MGGKALMFIRALLAFGVEDQLLVVIVTIHEFDLYQMIKLILFDKSNDNLLFLAGFGRHGDKFVGLIIYL
jgi:hypothetical protein